MSAQERAETARPGSEQEHGKGKASPDRDHNTQSKPSRVVLDADDLTARIACNRPDILEDMRAGKRLTVRVVARTVSIVAACVAVLWGRTGECP